MCVQEVPWLCRFRIILSPAHSWFLLTGVCIMHFLLRLGQDSAFYRVKKIQPSVMIQLADIVFLGGRRRSLNVLVVFSLSTAFATGRVSWPRYRGPTMHSWVWSAMHMAVLLECTHWLGPSPNWVWLLRWKVTEFLVLRYQRSPFQGRGGESFLKKCLIQRKFCRQITQLWGSISSTKIVSGNQILLVGA